MPFFTKKLANVASPFIKSLVNDVIDGNFESLANKADKRRLDIIEKNWNFYDGEHLPYIKKHFREKTEEFESKFKPYFNYTKLVVDQYIKGVFGQEIRYEFSNRSAQKVWDSITGDPLFFNIHGFMKKVQRAAELSNLALVIPRIDSVSKRIYFEMIRGEHVKFFPKENDPSRIGTILVDYVYDRGFRGEFDNRFVRRVEVWDEDIIQVYELYDIRGDKIPNLVFESENPYKDSEGNPILLPTRFVPEEDEDSWFGDSGINDIVELNTAYNYLWMDLFQILKFQTFSILFIKGESTTELTVSPSAFLKMPDDNADAKYIVPNAAISDFVSVLKMFKNELLDLSSLPIEVLSGSNKAVAESGYSLKMKRMPIEQLWNRRKVNYSTSTRELCKKSMIFVGVHNNKSGLYKNGDSVAIDYKELDIPVAASEKIVEDEWGLERGIKSEIDLIMEENPDLNRKQAEKRFEENLATRRHVLELKEKYLGKFSDENGNDGQAAKIRGKINAGIGGEDV